MGTIQAADVTLYPGDMVEAKQDLIANRRGIEMCC
jgi:hypothetical protein